jgi:hypothetical protein
MLLTQERKKTTVYERMREKKEKKTRMLSFLKNEKYIKSISKPVIRTLF